MTRTGNYGTVPKLAVYLDDRYLSSEDSDFVELIQADLDIFQQARQLDSEDTQSQTMAATRPPSSRGRGRGILRDYHNKTPGSRSDEESPHRGSPAQENRGNSRGQDTAAYSDRKERRDRKARRPDVQVYVPKGRRLQDKHSNTHQDPNPVASTNQINTALDNQEPELRRYRYSNSPQQKARASPQRSTKVPATDLKESDSPKYNSRSQEVHDINTDTGNIPGFADKQEMDKATALTKVEKGATCDENICDNANEVLISDTPFKDDVIENQFFCQGVQVNNEISMTNNEIPLNMFASEQQKQEVLESEDKISKYEVMYYSDTGANDNRCAKKMKITGASTQNVYNNLSDDPKLEQIIETKNDTKDRNIVSDCEASTPNQSATEYEVVSSNSDHQNMTVGSPDELISQDLIPVIADLNKIDKSHDENKTEDNIKCKSEQPSVECEHESITIYDQNCDSESKTSVSLFPGPSLVPEEDSSQIGYRQDEQKFMGDNSSDDRKEMAEDNLCDNEVNMSKTASCDSGNLSEENVVYKNEHHAISETEVLDKDEDNISSSKSGLSKTEDQNCGKTTEFGNDFNKEGNNLMMDIDNTKTKDGEVTVTKDSGDTISSSSAYDACNNIHDNGVDECKGEVLDSSDIRDEIQCHPMMTEDPQKPQGNLVAKRFIVHITPEQSTAQTDQSDVKPQSDSDQSTEQPQPGADQSDEESWDTMFDDNGDCLDPAALEELTRTVGKVKIQKSKKINYLDYKPKDKSAELDYTEYGHIIEIYDFPAEFVTRDLIMAFQAFMSRGFDLKWVDDTHALGVFSSNVAAQDALTTVHPLLKVCPLSQASPQSKAKARRCTEFLQPYKPRPETSAVAARRLVAGALGLQSNVPKEKRDKERQQLKEARAKRRQDKQSRDDIWEGRLGKCAMDEEG